MRMPVLFVGHGSPMNAIEPSRWSRGWERMGERISRLPEQPRAILAVSAHWATRGFFVSDAEKNRQVYDMYGFPDELYRVRYEPVGEPDVARRALELAGPVGLKASSDWGIDHGVWAVLVHLLPKADVPVVMASVDPTASPQAHFDLGRALAPLRDEGVLVLASGNVVHNLRRVSFDAPDGFAWARGFDAAVRDAVRAGDWDAAVDYRHLHPGATRAAESPEHLYPLMAALGAASPSEPVEVWNEGCLMGALSMTSYAFGMPSSVV